MIKILQTKSIVLTSEQKKSLMDKLKRIEGRVRKLSKMVEHDSQNTDILMQISSTIGALNIVSRALIQNCIESYVVNLGLNAINKEKKDAAYEEILDIIYKYVR